MMFTKLHPINLKQLASALRHPKFKEGIWFHGDGNMYTSQKESDDRATFYNQHPANIGAEFRKHFVKTDAIPADLEEMEAVLIAAHNEETAQRNLEATTTTLAPSLVFGADEVERKEKKETSISEDTMSTFTKKEVEIPAGDAPTPEEVAAAKEAIAAAGKPAAAAKSK